MKVDFRWTAAALVAMAAAGSAGYASGQVDQPHMQNALGALQNARHELDLAARDKAGHRGRAVQLVDEAIGEVRAGIAAGDQYRARHPR